MGHPSIRWFLCVARASSALPRQCTAARQSGSPGLGCRSMFRGSRSRFRRMFHSGAVPRSGRFRPCPGPGWGLRRRGVLGEFSFTRRVLTGGEGVCVRGGSIISDTFVHCRCLYILTTMFCSEKCWVCCIGPQKTCHMHKTLLFILLLRLFVLILLVSFLYNVCIIYFFQMPNSFSFALTYTTYMTLILFSTSG